METNKKQRSYSFKNFRLHTIERENSNNCLQKPKPRIKTQLQPQNEQNLDNQNDNQALEAYVKPKVSHSPIKQYETKLKISSESWVAYNIVERRYKRGWKPNKEAQFNGLLRVVVGRVFCKLAKENMISNLKVKASWTLSRSNRHKQSSSPYKRKEMKWLQSPFIDCLSNNTIISLRDVVSGMLITHYDDLLDYAIIYLGLVIRKIELKQALQDVQSVQDSVLAKENINKFIEYTNKFLKESLCLLNTTVGEFQLYSTSNEMSILFADCLSLQFFRQIQVTKQLIAPIKFQMGYKHYEDRVKKMVSQRPTMNNGLNFVFSFKGKRSYGVLSFNPSMQTLVVLQDCKFGMAETDIRKVQEWILNISRPIVTTAPLKKKVLPSLSLLEKCILS